MVLMTLHCHLNFVLKIQIWQWKPPLWTLRSAWLRAGLPACLVPTRCARGEVAFTHCLCTAAAQGSWAGSEISSWVVLCDSAADASALEHSQLCAHFILSKQNRHGAEGRDPSRAGPSPLLVASSLWRGARPRLAGSAQGTQPHPHTFPWRWRRSPSTLGCSILVLCVGGTQMLSARSEVPRTANTLGGIWGHPLGDRGGCWSTERWAGRCSTGGWGRVLAHWVGERADPLHLEAVGRSWVSPSPTSPLPELNLLRCSVSWAPEVLEWASPVPAELGP